MTTFVVRTSMIKCRVEPSPFTELEPEENAEGDPETLASIRRCNDRMLRGLEWENEVWAEYEFTVPNHTGGTTRIGVLRSGGIHGVHSTASKADVAEVFADEKADLVTHLRYLGIEVVDDD
jgi:hypothetical protein